MIAIGHASIPKPSEQRDTLKRIDRCHVTGAAAAVCFQAGPRRSWGFGGHRVRGVRADPGQVGEGGGGGGGGGLCQLCKHKHCLHSSLFKVWLTVSAMTRAVTDTTTGIGWIGSIELLPVTRSYLQTSSAVVGRGGPNEHLLYFVYITL